MSLDCNDEQKRVFKQVWLGIAEQCMCMDSSFWRHVLYVFLKNRILRHPDDDYYRALDPQADPSLYESSPLALGYDWVQ
jgi:hypothetical protein